MLPRHTAFLLAASVLTSAHAAPVDFARDIQPILSENCYHCHGPDAKAREADLRLDTKDGAYRTLDGVTPIKPGDSASSEAIIRVFTDDKDDLMPPPKSNRKLSTKEKELLKRWVEEGAPWGEHWAFVAPRRAAIPGNADFGLRIAELEKRDPARAADLRARLPELEQWPRNPIDHFVLAGLLDEGLAPSPAAPPEKLLRRLSLDLTGLPPTPPELDTLAASTDRRSTLDSQLATLLASPRYGERMVWEWLDAARYADTNGYQGDPTRAMWHWRDWAIRAFNDNMPFDRFTIEQLAGDLLPDPTREQLIATGFHRNHMINGEGGRIPEESRVDYVMDRVETTGTVWLGLTFNCCRCHDHKFDQLTQREYYQLSAYFNSIDETGGGGNDGQGFANPTISLANDEQQRKLDDLKAAVERVRKEGKEIEATLRAAQPRWEEELARAQSANQPAEVKWTQLTPDEMFTEKGTILTKTDDGAVFASGPAPERDEYVINIHARIGPITAFKLEALTDPSFKEGGPGRAPDHGNFVLSELTLQGGGKPVDLALVSADFEQGGTYTAKGPFDGDTKTGWAVYPRTGEPHTLIFEARGALAAEVLLSLRMSFQYGQQHTLGKFKLYATTADRALLRPTPKNIRNILAKPAGQRAQPEKDELTKYYFDTSPLLAGTRKRQDEAKKVREDAEKTIPRTMVMREREKPRDTFILEKGAYDKHGAKVAHGTPAALPALAVGAPPTRLALAQWLVSPDHPLTARVTVNRLWQQFFGRGLVKTVEDFGVQGEKPTHPELLDWLAREFIESGWDVKHLVRLIVTSATYQQSSRVPPGMSERDPENKLLARGPRHRLPSWMLRDQALAVSGLLVENLGGPPVKTYQPAGVWEDATFGQIKFTQDHGEALYRRSLYVFWRRIVGPTVFFDVANRQTCSVKNARTNTPLHALATMNDITYVEAARALAERMLECEAPDDNARLAFGFRLCTARVPGEREIATLTAALTRFRSQFASDPAAAEKLIATGESKRNPAHPGPELAAYTSVALLLLNLDETLSKE